MLTKLIINNLVLVERAEVPFLSGLNILTGETGSGKSALIDALHLVTGGRADFGLIRHGALSSSVEAHFADDLILRREMTANGRSRAFINDTLVPLTELREKGEQLLQIVDQHANQLFADLKAHRRLLDTYATTHSLIQTFQGQWEEYEAVRKQLSDLQAKEAERHRFTDHATRELEEIEEADLTPGEEEELFAEYCLLTTIEERQELAQEVLGVLPKLASQSIDQLATLDPTLTDTQELFHSLKIETDELRHQLNTYLSRLDSDPERLQHLNDRLTLINRLKKRYGTTVDEILAYAENLKNQLTAYSDTENERLKEALHTLKDSLDQTAARLTKARMEATLPFQAALQEELHELNLPNATVTFTLTPTPRGPFGDETVEIYFSPNKGEKTAPLRQAASGGELSRLLLAFQLATRADTPILIFDEIDANIGGATATQVGKKLKSLGKRHQVLCITHFPQVARLADHHLQVAKTEHNARTHTHITSLTPSARKQELARMSGQA